MRLSTDIQSGDTFYTDINGFQVASFLLLHYAGFSCLSKQPLSYSIFILSTCFKFKYVSTKITTPHSHSILAVIFAQGVGLGQRTFATNFNKWDCQIWFGIGEEKSISEEFALKTLQVGESNQILSKRLWSA